MSQKIMERFKQFVAPTYGRFPITLDRGEGAYVWDTDGKRYLDLGGGIAVNCLGHANAEIAQTLAEQSAKLMHCTNFYHFEGQVQLAEGLAKRLAQGRVFFGNSGAEASEVMLKLARRLGQAEGRFEIITAENSFHGRTMAGISASGQKKLKDGFAPLLDGFAHVPYNDIDAAQSAITPATVAVMIEGIQGEGGIRPASAKYLLGLRALCDEHNLLLLWDGVQCGHFRTGSFQSFQAILGDQIGDFLPDAVGMAKALGGGFPMGAVWISEKHADVLGPGTHGSTFGGNPLACAVANKILEVIDRDSLAVNARVLGQFFLDELSKLREKYPTAIREVRGLGLMIGIEMGGGFGSFDKSKPAALQWVFALHEAGLLTIPAGSSVIRFLPPLNLTQEEAQAGLDLFEQTIQKVIE
ncbi:MAG: acetylornithine transaminase [Verrucomicrobiota bacterium]|jgi:acetylornithine aminotransferase/acetylornithine/N-succinyldiaminopimelate aminotransferase|nr:acetylornithine transaminase [Verrucomicrobiota bacterium]